MDTPLVMFDFDGVLVDTVEFLEKVMREDLKKLGYDFLHTHEDMMNLFEDNVLVSLIDHGLTPNDMCAVWEHMQDASKKANIKLFPGVEGMLEAMSGRCYMVVVSSNSSVIIKDVLSRLGVLTRFKSVSGGEEELGKVERIKHCMKDFGAKPSKAIYIGDSAGDVREAHEAGCMAVAVSWGLHPLMRLAPSNPDCIVNNPSEIVDLVSAFSDE